MALLVAGGYGEAVYRASRALSWYPRDHPRIPYFAADVAHLCIAVQRFDDARELLRSALRAVDNPPSKLVMLALTARAFAGAGNIVKAVRLARRIRRLIPHYPSVEPVTRWHLAEAEYLAGRASQAEAEVQMALSATRRNNDLEARTLLMRLVTTLRSGETLEF